MSTFFLATEISIYLFAIYLFLYKGELAIVYLPVLIFAQTLIDPVFSASIFYITVSLLLLSLVLKNGSFYKYNIYSLILLFYFIVLLPRSSDLELIRPFIFGAFWLFTFIPLAAAVYRKYERDAVFKELNISATIILTLFLVNVLFSTLKGFSPHEMYGITKGIVYGNIYAAGFNVLAIALFISTLKFIEDRRIWSFIIILISLLLIMLSLRRSVMAISLIGLTIASLTLLNKERVKTFVTVGALTIVAAFVIYSVTDFADTFKERYELRKLDERELKEEKRFIEYELIYKDMFLYKDYSPLIGYEPFNSSGNYGRGMLEERSLHGDLTNIAHSSGLIGVLLYIMTVLTAFAIALKASKTKTDKLCILFCAITFIVYTITGRYTAISAMMLFYLVLLLPVAKENTATEDTPDEGIDAFHKPLPLKQSTTAD